MTERAVLEGIARALGERLGDLGLEGKVGFALLIFDFGTGGNLAWVSNAKRAAMLKAMQEFIEKGGGESILKH